MFDFSSCAYLRERWYADKLHARLTSEVNIASPCIVSAKQRSTLDAVIISKTNSIQTYNSSLQMDLLGR